MNALNELVRVGVLARVVKTITSSSLLERRFSSPFSPELRATYFEMHRGFVYLMITCLLHVSVPL